MNNDCEKYGGLIEDLVAGEELAEQTAAQTESHIFDCSECRNEYELLRREKEVLAHYLFEFEPPPNSWVNFQVRLVEENELSPSNVQASANSSRPKKRIFVFGFSPALAAYAGLLLMAAGIGFVWLKTSLLDGDADKYVAVTKLKDSQPPPVGEINRNPTVNPSPRNVGNDSTVPQTDEPAFGNASLKSKNKSLAAKKSFADETFVKAQRADSSNQKIKSANNIKLDEAQRLTALRMKNLETEIAVQMEKAELLLRSFRNAQANETGEGFDIEYEKKQARKLLDKNAQLRRDAENYGISYAEELLSRIEPYLLDIANLEVNPSTDKVLDIKERVSNQNIIASLQVY